MANNPWAADVARIKAAIERQQAIIAKFKGQLAAEPGNAGIQQSIDSARSYLAGLQQQLNIFLIEFNNFAAQPTVSSGDIVGNANLARDEGANATRPPTGQEVITPTGRIEPAGGNSGTNAEPTPTTENTPTTGTDAPVRPITQTQATTYNNNGTLTQAQLAALQRNPGSGSSYAPSGGPGGGSRGDDNTPATPSVVVNRLDALYAAKNNFIQERTNVLDNYPSYTYSLSWYLVDPTAYNTTIRSIKKNLNGYYLLAQSGGASQNINAVQENVFDPRQEIQESVFNPAGTGPAAPTGYNRSPYFNLDYYLDNLTIETAYSAKIESGGPMAYKNISFTVSEPNGLTLPLNLYRAVNEVYNQRVRTSSDNSSFINYASGMYCMVIRFYGYNEQGQLVQPITNNIGSTDPSAAVEKFIFYQQTSLSYSVGSKLTEYKITGAAPSTRIGFSSDRGSIPFNAQFTGTTVKDILVGQIQQQTASQAAGDQTRNGNPIKSSPPVKVGDLSTREQAAIAAGTDPNTVNDQGMAFGGGGL